MTVRSSTINISGGNPGSFTDLTITGVAYFAGGTDLAPSIAFTSETTLGFYRDGAGVISATKDFKADTLSARAQIGGALGNESIAMDYAGNGRILSPNAGGTFTTPITIVNPITIGNTVNVVSPTAPNRTITMIVDGVTLYLHAKTTND